VEINLAPDIRRIERRKKKDFYVFGALEIMGLLRSPQ